MVEVSKRSKLRAGEIEILKLLNNRELRYKELKSKFTLCGRSLDVYLESLVLREYILHPAKRRPYTITKSGKGALEAVDTTQIITDSTIGGILALNSDQYLAKLQYFYLGKEDNFTEIIKNRQIYSGRNLIRDIFGLAVAKSVLPEEYIKNPEEIANMNKKELYKIWNKLFPDTKEIIIVERVSLPTIADVLTRIGGRKIRANFFEGCKYSPEYESFIDESR